MNHRLVRFDRLGRLVLCYRWARWRLLNHLLVRLFQWFPLFRLFLLVLWRLLTHRLGRLFRLGLLDLFVLWDLLVL